MVIHCPNCSIVVSQGIGRPQEKERDGGNNQQVDKSEQIQLSVKFAVLCGYGLCCSKTITTVTSKILITDHCNKGNNNERFEMLLKSIKTEMVLINLLDIGLPQNFDL